jgi:TRAP-type mannitol/chloroaromatic compound transport system permease small subunit
VTAIAAFVRAVDRFNDWLGRSLAWLILGSVVVCATTAILRYWVNIGFVWMQEFYVVLFAMNFTLAAGFAYARNQHVRVDIFSTRMTERQRAWIEMIGFLVLMLPWLVAVTYAAFPFVVLSWSILESSSSAGGLPGFFIVKSAIPAFCLLLGVQGLAACGRSVLILTGHDEFLAPRPDAAAGG